MIMSILHNLLVATRPTSGRPPPGLTCGIASTDVSHPGPACLAAARWAEMPADTVGRKGWVLGCLIEKEPSEASLPCEAGAARLGKVRRWRQPQASLTPLRPHQRPEPENRLQGSRTRSTCMSRQAADGGICLGLLFSLASLPCPPGPRGWEWPPGPRLCSALLRPKAGGHGEPAGRLSSPSLPQVILEPRAGEDQLRGKTYLFLHPDLEEPSQWCPQLWSHGPEPPSRWRPWERSSFPVAKTRSLYFPGRDDNEQ